MGLFEFNIFEITRFLTDLKKECQKMIDPYKKNLERLLDKKNHDIWMQIIRQGIRIGSPEAILNALINSTVWLTVRIQKVLSKEALWQNLGERFKTIISPEIQSAIVSEPTADETVSFVIGTPRSLFGVADVTAGKPFDSSYLAERNLAKCQSFDLPFLLRNDQFNLPGEKDGEKAIVWTEPLTHPQFVGPSLFELVLVKATGGAELVVTNPISIGLGVVTDKIDLDTPIILRVLPASIVPPPADAIEDEVMSQ